MDILQNTTDLAISKRANAVEIFLKEGLGGVVPRILGKPTKFKLWVCGVKLEVHKTPDPLSDIYILKQWGKVISKCQISIKIIT